MKNRSFFIFLLVFLALLTGAYGLYSHLSTGAEIVSLVAPNGSNVAVEPHAEADPNPPVSESSAIPEEEKTSQAAPDFTAIDRDGNEVTLSDFRGKPVVLNFWASWCVPCQIEMPIFEEAYTTYGEDIHFLMVNLTDGSRETVETAAEYLDSNGYTFPVYFDTSYSGAIAYSVMSIPVTFFIDAEGNVAAYTSSSISAAILQTGIDMIFTP